MSLEINEGEIFGLLGPNGAGKTTTLSMLATLLPPTSGHALINGFDVMKHPTQVRRSIGFVFQDPSSDDLLTGRENLYLHALMYGVKDSEINKKIDEGLISEINVLVPDTGTKTYPEINPKTRYRIVFSGNSLNSIHSLYKYDGFVWKKIQPPDLR